MRDIPTNSSTITTIFKHYFYMLLGTASAALVALLFVAASIGRVFSRPSAASPGALS